MPGTTPGIFVCSKGKSQPKKKHKKAKKENVTIIGWHALRYSEGRAALASYARPSGYLRACHSRSDIAMSMPIVRILSVMVTFGVDYRGGGGSFNVAALPSRALR